MSFLVGVGDLSTLEGVVAFIDSWDAGSTSPGDVTTSESENDSSPFSNEDVESVLLDSLDDMLEDASFPPKKEPESMEKKPTKKKRKKTPGASTRLQRRKKAEILALRALSEQLGGRLEQLKRTHAGPGPSSVSLSLLGERDTTSMSKSTWSEIAATQFQERFKSEVTNQRLRAVLMEQMKVNEALREAFQIQASVGNLEVIFGKQPGPVVRQPTADNSFAVIGELEKMVEGLYRNSAAVFQPRGELSACISLNVKHEKAHDTMLEITATTPLPCSVREASAMYWREFLTIHQSNDKSYHFLRQRKPTSVEKSFKWGLRSGETVMEINGFSFVRKIEEANRVVLVEAGRLLLPAEGLHLRIRRWTIITRSEDGRKPDSVARTLFQLHTKHTEGFTSAKEGSRGVEDLVLGVLSTRLREYLHRQQTEAVLEAEQIRMATRSAMLIKNR
ncbi:hypothetical protein PHYPSEUDO_010695 [Phytophthora pseudosyringae]|uniref:M96 mating-specific protein family n=1 Tax=Phytophthora pseudosyringae TaxID=221518 RepID=A0A8T1VAC7_9STRA|nr:hypothetical protein PHYPSEUDO_010695 [Phytophthora pseudosyringae]